MKLYVVDLRGKPLELRYTMLSLQGIVNKHLKETGEGIYCIWEHGRWWFNREQHEPESLRWLRIYEQKGLVDPERMSLPELIKLVRKYCDGYVVADPRLPHSVNVATTLASVEDTLIVFPKYEKILNIAGLKKRMDLRVVNDFVWGNDSTKCYEWQYDNLFNKCNKDLIKFDGGFRFQIDHTISFNACSVDFNRREHIPIAMKYFKSIRYYGLCLGYPDRTALEWPMVIATSRAGLRSELMPALRGAPFAINYSIHSQMPKAEYHQENTVEVDYKDDKIYLAFGLSDLGFGMLQGFYYDQWLDPFRTSEKRTVKLNWWMDALAQDVAPQIAKYYYDTRHDLDLFYSAHVYGRIRPSDFPNLRDYLERGKDKLKNMDLKAVAFSNYHKWDDRVFREYSSVLKDTVSGFIYGFGPEFGDRQCMVINGMPWVFTTFLKHGSEETARMVYDYIKKHETPQFLVYGCAFGYQIPYAKLVQMLQYIHNYLKEKLGNRYVNVNAVELCEVAKQGCVSKNELWWEILLAFGGLAALFGAAWLASRR